SGQLHRRHQDGMDHRLGALGLVFDALVLVTTRHTDAAVNQLSADGCDVRDEDVARLSPFVPHRHSRPLFLPAPRPARRLATVA
ncbi:transposase, partial [Streptomyces sp. TRM76130]|nr:transposase [Streptomyces sp. TRM76130]